MQAPFHPPPAGNAEEKPRPEQPRGMNARSTGRTNLDDFRRIGVCGAPPTKDLVRGSSYGAWPPVDGSVGAQLARSRCTTRAPELCNRPATSAHRPARHGGFRQCPRASALFQSLVAVAWRSPCRATVATSLPCHSFALRADGPASRAMGSRSTIGVMWIGVMWGTLRRSPHILRQTLRRSENTEGNLKMKRVARRDAMP